MTTNALIDLFPVRVQLERGDVKGAFVFRDGHVVAMLVRVEDRRYGAKPGRWKVEATFGQGSFRSPPVFDSIGLAARWFKDPANETSDAPHVRVMAPEGAGHAGWNLTQTAG